MKKAHIIVDTCIWIEYFTGTSKIKEAITILINEHSSFLCGIVVYELFQGIKTPKKEKWSKAILRLSPI